MGEDKSETKALFRREIKREEIKGWLESAASQFTSHANDEDFLDYVMSKVAAIRQKFPDFEDFMEMFYPALLTRMSDLLFSPIFDYQVKWKQAYDLLRATRLDVEWHEPSVNTPYSEKIEKDKNLTYDFSGLKEKWEKDYEEYFSKVK